MPRNVVKYPVATTVRQHNGCLSVVYHSTEVVNINKNGVITLRAGGWLTSTTKRRINQYAPGVSVQSIRGTWKVDYQGKTYDFAEGMMLFPSERYDGNCVKFAT